RRDTLAPLCRRRSRPSGSGRPAAASAARPEMPRHTPDTTSRASRSRGWLESPSIAAGGADHLKRGHVDAYLRAEAHHVPGDAHLVPVVRFRFVVDRIEQTEREVFRLAG